MPVSDELVIRYLLQLTESSLKDLIWSESGSGGFWAEINDVRLTLQEISFRSGSHVCLSLHKGVDNANIEEPHVISVFGSHYSTDENRDLAICLRELWQAVKKQFYTRLALSEENRDEIRQSIFRRLLFGTEA